MNAGLRASLVAALLGAVGCTPVHYRDRAARQAERLPGDTDPTLDTTSLAPPWVDRQRNTTSPAPRNSVHGSISSPAG